MKTLLYSFSHFGKTLLWVFFNLYYLYFCIYALGISPHIAGLVIFLFTVLDTALDIPAGFIIQKYLPQFGGMRIWVNIATPVCALFIALAFWGGDVGEYKIAASIFCALLFRAFFTLVDVPLNASIGRFNRDSRGRVSIAAARSISASLARIVVALITALFLEIEGKIVADTLWAGAAIIAILAPVAIIPAFCKVDRLAYTQEAQRQEPPPETAMAFVRLSAASINSNFILLLLANWVFIIFASQLYSAVLFWVTGSNQTVPFSSVWLLMTLVSIASVWIWTALARKTEKKWSAMLSLFLVGAVALAFPFLSQTAGGIIWIALSLAAVYHTNTIIWSILPDIVDEMSSQGDIDLDAPIIGIFAALGKMAIGFSQFLGGLFLSWSGFPDNPDFSTYQTYLAGSTIFGCLVCILLFHRLRLSHKQHSAIIAQRHSGIAHKDGSKD